MAWCAAYRAYGNLAVAFVDAVAQPLRFQGQYFDAESGLHYNRHRYYSPETARFITPDPIRLAGGLNQTQYVPNPTGWVDPLGLMSVPGKCPPDPDVQAGVKTGEPDAPSANIAHSAQAKVLGYTKVNERSHGQPVYFNKKASNNMKYITPDVDQHNGGFWKAAESVKALGSKKTRTGTYNITLNRIGD